MADKSTSGLPVLKDENLCLTILGLVCKSGNWGSWFFALKLFYIHLPCTVDRGGASVLSQGNASTKEKSPYQTVNMEKQLRARWRYVKNYLHANLKEAKKTLQPNAVTATASPEAVANL